MWIPYDVRASLKAESDREIVGLSRADRSERPFLVGFYVRNPVTQQWELDLLPPDQPVTRRGLQDIEISLHANDAGKVSEILCRLDACSAEEAVDLAYDAVSRLLLRYIAETGRGMAIAGWRVADMVHNARWRCTPFRPSALRIDHTLPPVDDDLAPFARLMQRARNAPDPETRLMAAYALLRAALRGNPALRRCGADEFRVSQEMLVHAGALDACGNLAGSDLRQLLEALRPHHDRLLEDGALAAVPDRLSEQQQLLRLANLADLAAHRLLHAEIRARMNETMRQPVEV